MADTVPQLEKAILRNLVLHKGKAGVTDAALHKYVSCLLDKTPEEAVMARTPLVVVRHSGVFENLCRRGLIKCDDDGRYTLTRKGWDEVMPKIPHKETTDGDETVRMAIEQARADVHREIDLVFASLYEKLKLV